MAATKAAAHGYDGRVAQSGEDRNLKTVRTECNVGPPFAPSAKTKPHSPQRMGHPQDREG